MYSPSKKERENLAKLLPILADAERTAANRRGIGHVAHGFIRGRSPVTCAMAHRDMAMSICIDLAGWFDSVTPEQIAKGLLWTNMTQKEALSLAKKVCHLGAPRQGLMTSPAACNVAAQEMDAMILELLGNAKAAGAFGRWTYTRYADDLTVSTDSDSTEAEEAVMLALRTAVDRMGWKIAEDKSEIQRSQQGDRQVRRVIVGVSVGSNVTASRKTRRKLRAAEHRKKHAKGKLLARAKRSAAGLGEWCAMKLPNLARPSRQIIGANDLILDAAKNKAGAEASATVAGTGRRLTKMEQQ